MSKILISLVILFGLETGWACIGPDVSVEEATTIQNELAVQIMNQEGLSIQKVEKVTIAPGFILSRGQKGSCTALNAFGLIRIETRDQCVYTSHVSTDLQGLQFETHENCKGNDSI